MPTVPIKFTRYYHAAHTFRPSIYLNYHTGTNPIATTLYVQGDTFTPLTPTSWPPTPDMPAGTSIDPPLSYNWNAASNIYFEGVVGTGTVTYPDTWRRFSIDTTVANLYGNYSLLSKCVGPSLSGRISSATMNDLSGLNWSMVAGAIVDVTMYPSNTVTLNIVWDFGDGATFTETKTSTTNNITFSASHVWSGPIAGFPTVKVTDQYGQWDQQGFILSPTSSIGAAYNEDSDSWHFDALSSVHVTGSNPKYVWRHPKFSLFLGTDGLTAFDKFGPTNWTQFATTAEDDEQLDPSKWFGSLDENGNRALTIWLSYSVTNPSGWGFSGDYTANPIKTIYLPPTPELEGFGLLRTTLGTLISAVKSGDSTQFYSIPDGIATKTARALVLNTRSPSIWRDRAGGVWMLAQKNKAEWRLFGSIDSARTFTESVMFWDANFTHGWAIGIKTAVTPDAIATLAVEKATKQLKFKISNDGGVTFGTVYTVATLAKAEQFRIEQVNGGELRITNGLSLMWKSTNTGRSWNPS